MTEQDYTAITPYGERPPIEDIDPGDMDFVGGKPDSSDEGDDNDETVIIDDIKCRVTPDGVLLDRVHIDFDDERLEVLELFDDEVRGTFKDGQLHWHFGGSVEQFNELLAEENAIAVNENKDQNKRGASSAPAEDRITDPDIIYRFFGYVDLPDNYNQDDCWLWTGWTTGNDDEDEDGDGYGGFWVSSKEGDRSAHRVSARIHFGGIPAWHVVRHVGCTNTTCVNPEHIAVGTQRDNIRDAVKRGNHVRGTDLTNGLAANTVREIRVRYALTDAIMSELADEYDRCPATIQRLVSHKTYDHIDVPAFNPIVGRCTRTGDSRVYK